MSRSTLRRNVAGVSFLELVLSITLLVVAIGGVFSVLAFGAGYPIRAQQAGLRDSYARTLLDQEIGSGNPSTSAYAPIVGAPDYQGKVTISPASYDPNALIVQVDVMGPKPLTAVTTLRSGFCQPSGAALLTQYGCLNCHIVGTGAPNTLAPYFNKANLEADTIAENNALGCSLTNDSYIEQSVRNPNGYVVPGYTVKMTSYPSIMNMPQSDLNAIRIYLRSLP